MSDQDNSMTFDVVIVGAGPAGLSAAIRLKQLKPELSVAILEKGSEVGAHILSGAVFEPRALNELIPDWKEKGAPLTTPVKKDEFLLLTKRVGYRLLTPRQMHNDGNYIISLANLCRWLAEQAVSLGVEIYTGFAAAKTIIENGRVVGVETGEMGVAKNGEHKTLYQPSVRLNATYTLFAEGCRGSLTEKLIENQNLRAEAEPQTYALGLKEIWEIDPKKHKEGKVVHTLGWPLKRDVYGGSFIYHMANHQLAIGLVVGLDYANPYLSPYEEFQKFKTHPLIKELLKNGKRVAYGARALNEGGYQSIPKVTCAGAAIIGCGAGFVNVPKIKGSHTAMKTGMLAAEAIAEGNLATYHDRLKESWVIEELYQVRNIRPGFHKGLFRGLINAGLETYIRKGKGNVTLSHQGSDYQKTKKASKYKPIAYPKHDNVLTFDRLTSVQLTGTNHEEDQPCHLTLKDPSKAVEVNLKEYAGLEQYYCPAHVYEYVDDGKGSGGKRLQINAANCIHCKTCDIKDPTQNIVWTTPEGGEGPRYPNM